MTEPGPSHRFDRCIAAGGVAVFPSDTVYGLACDPLHEGAVNRLYALKARSRAKPSAVMFFALDCALAVLPELPARTREAVCKLLPGAVSLLLANPQRRFPLACGEDPETLGLRVVHVAQLTAARSAVLQSSANVAGGPDPRRLAEVPDSIRAAADLVIDAGPLPGTPSTVIDLRRYEHDGSWSVIRAGAVPRKVVAAALA